MHLSSPKLAVLRATNLEVTREVDGDPVRWIYFSYKLTFHYFDSYIHSSWRCTQSCTHQRVFHGYGGIPRCRQAAWF